METSGLLYLFILTTFIHGNCGQRGCPPGTYLDTVTGRCDSCSDLCQAAVIQGTLDQCRILCQDSLKDVTDHRCPAGQYFDVALSQCDHCSSICANHKQQGTTKSCMQYCPQEYNDDTLRESVLPRTTSNSGGYDSNVFLPAIHVGVVVTTCCVVVVVVVVVVVFRHQIRQRLKCFKTKPEQCPDDNLLKAGSSDDDVHLSIEEGFTDMRSFRRCSADDIN